MKKFTADQFQTCAQICVAMNKVIDKINFLFSVVDIVDLERKARAELEKVHFCAECNCLAEYEPYFGKVLCKSCRWSSDSIWQMAAQYREWLNEE